MPPPARCLAICCTNRCSPPLRPIQTPSLSIGEDYTLTFGELTDRARLLAHELQAVLTPADRLVAILMDKGFEQIVAALAVLENGRTFLPISASQPDQRIQTILSQAGVRVALIQPQMRRGRFWQDQVVLLEVTREPIPRAVPPRLPQTASPTDAAYVIYTSGSTGVPKGVTIKHQAARNTIADLTERFAITRADRILWVSSFEFDLSIFDLFGILAAGGAVVVPAAHSNQNPIVWAEAVHQHRVTVWNSVPALAELMLSAADHDTALLASLRLMMLSGDWIPVALAGRIRKQLPACRLFSLGGATEASIWSIFHPIEHVDPQWVSVPYGKPLRNQTFHVLKNDLAPCPIHTTGKLFIGGAGLALGYWNNPEQTAARFITHPLTGERLYDTGDLGRYRPDGAIEFLGREDAQVKLRGFRIELGEIEAALLCEPQIAQAAAMAREDTPSDRRIVAYLVPEVAGQNGQRHPKPIDLLKLRQRLATRLPDYMVPAAFVMLEALPLTSNGKVDRKALPAPEGSGLAAGYVAPNTPEGILLCQFVAELLSLERVGLADNFFHLGGDSISAIRLVSRARENGLLITPKDVFLHPVLDELILTTHSSPDQEPSVSDADVVLMDQKEIEDFEQQYPDLEEIWPLAPLQEGLLFHAHYQNDGEDPYLVQLALELNGTLDPIRLRRALDALLDRHPNLRVHFHWNRGGRPLQIVHARCAIPWCERDLSALEPDERDRLAREIEAEDRRTRFALEQAPLIRATLLHLGPDHSRLLLTQHHLLSDGWSSSILLQDLLALYRKQDHAGALLRPPAFKDYLAWLQKQDQQAARDAWRSYLAGIAAPTRLGSAISKDAPLRQAQIEEHLSADFTAKLETLARQNGLTLAIVLQGAWSILLARLTNQNDVVYGQVSSGRQALVPGIEHILGLLITTTPARARLHPAESVLAFLKRLQRDQAALLPHQHLPLAEIHKIAGEQILFDTLFTYENYPVDSLKVPAAADDLPLREVRGQNSNHYPLSLAVIPGDGLNLRFHYSADLFDRAAAERVAERLVRLLEQIAADPARPLHRLEILDPAERRQLVRDFNETAAPLPQATLVEMFEQQVRKTPDHVALLFEDRQWTYAELDARANQLAWRLIADGIGPEDIVAICLERSIEMVVAILATLKAGAAYLPLDPDYPAERLAFLLEDARPKRILTSSALCAKLPEASHGLCLLLDTPEVATDLAGFAASAPADADRTTPLRPQHPAYLIYTSGSTGKPKGVIVAHAGLPSLAQAQINRVRVTETSRVLQLASWSFDAALSEMAMALCSGATLVLATRDERGGRSLDHLVAGRNVTHATFTPTVIKTLTAESATSLQAIIIAGESCSADIATRWAARFRVINAYGPTEATVCATMTTPLNIEGNTPPIGAPIANTRVYVLDADLQPCPMDVVGELYIAGVGLARGYWNRPALTAARFIANPFALDPGERLYRTGDLASWRDDGNLIFHGRADQQVKIRGFRIEPGEIEAALLGEPSITQAAVIAREDTAGDKRLVAYLVAGKDEQGQHTAIDLRGLRQHLAERLPEYMVPAAFVVLDALPLTPNGKLDRKALPALDGSGLAAGYVAPNTPEEIVLCELVAELLDLERVGLGDNFFHLGGDSISSIRLVSSARERGLSITPRDVFLHPVLGDLAHTTHRRSDIASHVVNGIAEGPLPATPIIRRLLAQTGPWKNFSQAVLLQTPANLDETALLASLQALLDHHDALRLRVDQDGSLLIPHAGSVHASSCLQRLSLAGLDILERQDTLRSALQDGMNRLDPHAGALFRGVWAEAEPGQSGRLLLIIHHLAIDGVSWRVLLPDLAAAYAAAVAGQAVVLRSKTTSFRRWAEKLVAAAPGRRNELPFWNDMASKLAPALVADTVDTARDTIGTAVSIERTLSSETTAALLTTVSAAFHARINDVLLTGLVLATAAWGSARGQTDNLALRLDLEGHGREPLDPTIDLTRTVGWFTTLYPLHLDPGAIDLADALAGGPAAGQTLKQIKEQLRAVPTNGLGYGMLRYLDHESAGELGRHPAPQISFNYLGRFSTGDGADWQPVRDGVLIGHADSAFPLEHPIALNAITYDTPDGPALHANWTFAPALISETEANRLADAWSKALEALVRHAGQPGAGGFTPSDLDLVALDQKEIEVFERQYPDLEEIWPLAPLQEGLLFHAHYQNDGEDPYLVQLALELNGTLDPIRLRRALDALLDRHPNLRVHFHWNRGGRPLQIVHARCAIPWCERDLSALEPDERDRLAREIEAEDRRTRFALEQAPLIRATLLHLGPDHSRLLLTQHHLLSDGWSSSILLQDLLALYRKQDHAGALPRPPAFKDYLAWLQKQDQQAARDAWRSYLAGIAAPTRLGPAISKDAPLRQAQIEEHLSADFTAKLETLARQNGLTLAIVLQGAWSILLARLTNQNDVVYGQVSSGRQALVPGIEHILGLLITTTPARARLHPAESVLAFLKRLQRDQAALLPHQHLPLAEIHKIAGEQILFDTLFTYENYPVDSLKVPAAADDLPLREVRGQNSNHYPLSLAVIPGDGLNLRLHYSAELFDRASAERVAERLVRLLEQIAADPARPLHRLEILHPAERRQLVRDFNETAAPLPQATLVEMFEQQVRKTPDHVAVIFEDRQWTYAELNAYANQLAWKLIADGIGPEDIVAICLERSIEMVVAILATLKAGAAYLPLDPDYPAERLAYPARRCTAQEDSDELCSVREVCQRPRTDSVCCWMRRRLPLIWPASLHRLRPTPIAPRRCGRSILPTSSTPRAAPESPRAWPSLSRASPITSIWQEAKFSVLAPAMPLFTSAVFDLTLTSIFAPLCFDGQIRVIPQKNAQEAVEEIFSGEQAPSAVKLTPSHIALLATLPGHTSTIETAIVGGETLTAAQVKTLEEHCPGIRVFNEYGPTETTVGAIAGYVSGNDIHIGRPYANTRVYVLDAGLATLPHRRGGRVVHRRSRLGSWLLEPSGTDG